MNVAVAFVYENMHRYGVQSSDEGVFMMLGKNIFSAPDISTLMAISKNEHWEIDKDTLRLHDFNSIARIMYILRHDKSLSLEKQTKLINFLKDFKNICKTLDIEVDAYINIFIDRFIRDEASGVNSVFSSEEVEILSGLIDAGEKLVVRFFYMGEYVTDHKPDWMVYPHQFLRVVTQSLIDLKPWKIMTGESSLIKRKELADYSSVNIFPFAYNEDGSFACWLEGEKQKIFIIRPVSKKLETLHTFDNFWDWLENAIEDTIADQGDLKKQLSIHNLGDALAREYIQDKSVKPDWLVYSPHYLRILEQSLIHLTPWHIMTAEESMKSRNGLSDRHPCRDAFPFAYKHDIDEVACWVKGEGEKVYVINEFSPEGWEMAYVVDDFLEWFRIAVRDTIDWDY